MSIQKNAVDSIAIGIEDYRSNDPRRLLSATRNIVAGIFLLYKSKLSDMSPAGTDDALIKEHLVPVIDSSSGLIWRGKGKKTVDSQQIRERFENLKIAVDWKRVARIITHRNDIEHYFTTLSQSAIRSLIADAFILIRDFVRVHLEEDPLNLLGQDTWKVLTDVAEVYEAERKDCGSRIAAIDWRFDELKNAILEWSCPECGSGLMDVVTTCVDRWNVVFKCRSCGKEIAFEEGAEAAIINTRAAEDHLLIKDEGDPLIIRCPNCFHDTYDLGLNSCLLCEETIERECQRCGMDIPPEELDGEGYCSYCAHMMAKDD